MDVSLLLAFNNGLILQWMTGNIIANRRINVIFPLTFRFVYSGICSGLDPNPFDSDFSHFVFSTFTVSNCTVCSSSDWGPQIYIIIIGS